MDGFVSRPLDTGSRTLIRVQDKVRLLKSGAARKAIQTFLSTRVPAIMS